MSENSSFKTDSDWDEYTN